MCARVSVGLMAAIRHRREPRKMIQINAFEQGQARASLSSSTFVHEIGFSFFFLLLLVHFAYLFVSGENAEHIIKYFWRTKNIFRIKYSP